MNQELRLEVKQLITPQLLLNLKLLALPNLELETLIRQELEKNPALETVDDETESFETSNPVADNDEFDITDFINDDSIYSPVPIPQDARDTDRDISEIKTVEKSNFDETLLPIVKSLIDEDEVPIAEYILGNLTDDGFLLLSVNEISDALKVPVESVQKIINIVQGIEPGGIAAPNLQTALVCQLKLLGFNEESIEIKIVRDHFDLLLKKNFAKIRQLLKITDKEISLALANIQNLETRPARRYLNAPTNYITPDFAIKWQDDKLIGYINDESIPVLRISPRYREIVLNPKNFSKEEFDFARKRLQSAIMIIKGIEARKKLLNDILKYLVDNQRDFFIHGKEYIKPILIKDIASALNVHISTISRAVQNKYVETPVGIFPLRFFFTTGIGEHSRISIKEKIKEIINSEDKTNPYTDDQIVALLEKHNIKLSRRTVAKYREEMKIPGSNERMTIT
ncbi:MAG: RNA polymerase factor sigma-54 [candidate division WOR-3 bacterium]|nr:RNA polymerase factor sigma-54 [candidate division WOR-3 bacterium]